MLKDVSSYVLQPTGGFQQQGYLSEYCLSSFLSTAILNMILCCSDTWKVESLMQLF